MSEIKSVSTHSSKKWHNGKYRKRFNVVVTDEQGTDHEFITSPFHTDQDSIGDDIAAGFLQNLKAGELSSYVNKLERGENPFEKSSEWNSRSELLDHVLSEALSRPGSDPMLLNSIQLLDNVTDAELKSITGMTDDEVANVRSMQSTLKTGRDILQSYVPILGGS